jgi:zinc-ribbon domain
MPSIPRGSEQRAGEEAPTTEAPAVPAPDGATAEPQAAPGDAAPRFRQRARMRRRLRYLRRLRELAFRDLGGLVFDLHRFGRRREDLVQGKLEALREIDAELRTLETALDDRREYTDLREAGVAACPRCGALHDTGANFCPGCGTSLRGSVAEGDAAQPEQQPSSTPS